MKKEQKLQDDNKVGMFEYSEMAIQMIEQRKKEFANLQHNYLLATVALKNVQEQIANERVAFEQLKKAEEQKRNNALLKKEQDLDAKHYALDINVRNFDKRSADLKEREIAVAHLFEDRNKLNNDRIEVERLRTKAEDLMSQAVKRNAEANAIFNSSRQKEEEAKKSLTKSNGMNANLTVREAQHAKQAEELISRINNLKELHAAIDPKMKELESLDTHNKAKDAELSVREKEVARKLDEDKSIVIAFSEREKKLKERETDVDTREREVARKMLLLKGTGK